MKSASRDARRRQADIERQARAWIRLLASGQATLHDAEALKLWCAASEAHAAAFALERRFWNQVGPAAQQLQRQTARASHARPAARAWGRRAFLARRWAARPPPPSPRRWRAAVRSVALVR